MQPTFTKWLHSATDTKLTLEHDALRRVLALPGADLFPGYSQQISQAAAIWAELQHRRAAREIGVAA